MSNSKNEVAESGAKVRRRMPDVAPLLGFLILLTIFFTVTSEYFLDVDNFKNIFVALAVTGVVCVPGTMLMIAGQVDLSVGSAAAVSGMILGNVVNSYGIANGLLAVLIFGLVIGAVNGFFVTVIGVNSLITTLGTLATLYGIALLIGNGQTLMMKNFEWLGTAQPAGIPLPIIIFFVIAVVGIVVLRRTRFGRSLYAIGSNPNAARVVGIRSNRILFATFVLSGLSSALAGAILCSQLSAGDPNAARGLELEVITAIVLGGASLAGGRGTMWGTIIGLTTIGVLNNGLILLDVPTFWQRVAQGLMLIL
ncbi:MAG: ABC transporter permease, partial [Actinobacteria bacterium]|nr:ABC transporter permease [Actinomycetota bacterium]